MSGSGQCSHCGAAIGGNQVCRYCGAIAAASGDAREQQSALAELHEHIGKADRGKKEDLLRNGYIPDHPKVLIEAGVKCIPLIDSGEVRWGVTEAAVHRLKAIVTKLRLLPESKETGKAIEQFEAALARYAKDDRNSTVLGCVILGALAAVGIGYWLLGR